MQKLYLVTRAGERHEDHIPCGVFTFDKFKEKFPSPITEDQFIPNEWKDVYCLNLEDHSFSPEEISKYTESNEAFEEFENSIENHWNGQYFEYHVIQICVNADMEQT